MNSISKNVAGNRTFRIMLGLSLTVFILVLTQATGFAVEPRKPAKASWTAESNAAMRAIAAREPDEKIRNPDYMAEKLVSPEFWSNSYGLDFDNARRYIETYQKRYYRTINARTKHIDALLQHHVAQGVTQVVILGAGYDSRAYRFQNLSQGLRFFEVDLPAIQALKRRRVVQILGAKPKGVVYVPIDFDTQSLEGVLKKAGYDETQKTFFVWEGVTMYITEQGADNTLSYIAHHSGPGSSVVFDYVFRRVIEGDVRDYECSRARARAAYKGEPWTFGIPEGEANRYVEEKGLTLLSDLTAHELARMYLTRTDGSIDGKVFGCGRILHASVPITTSKGQ